MYGLETYGRVRRAVLRDGMSEREAARVFGLDRGTVSKMVKFSTPPGYRRTAPRKRVQMDAHAAFIDAILTQGLRLRDRRRATASGAAPSSGVEVPDVAVDLPALTRLLADHDVFPGQGGVAHLARKSSDCD